MVLKICAKQISSKKIGLKAISGSCGVDKVLEEPNITGLSPSEGDLQFLESLLVLTCLLF